VYASRRGILSLKKKVEKEGPPSLYKKEIEDHQMELLTRNGRKTLATSREKRKNLSTGGRSLPRKKKSSEVEENISISILREVYTSRARTRKCEGARVLAP